MPSPLRSVLHRLRRAWRACVLGLPLMLCLPMPAGAANPPPPAASGAGPVEVTAGFYRRYIATFLSDHDPMFELVQHGDAALSGQLMQRLRAGMDDPAWLDRDYFLQVEDGVRPCREPSVTPVHTQGAHAEVAVQLGDTTGAAWQLRVALAKEDGHWQLLKVSRTRASGLAHLQASCRPAPLPQP